VLVQYVGRRKANDDNKRGYKHVCQPASRNVVGIDNNIPLAYMYKDIMSGIEEEGVFIYVVHLEMENPVKHIVDADKEEG
jgi:hypothetical protein